MRWRWIHKKKNSTNHKAQGPISQCQMKKKRIPKRIKKQIIELKQGKSLKLMDWVRRLGLPYKKQTWKNYKAKFSIIKNKK